MVAHTRLGEGLSNTGRGLLNGTQIADYINGTRISPITSTETQRDADLAQTT